MKHFCRSSQPRCSLEKVFPKILQISQENICARASLVIKLQAACNIIKKRPWYKCFPVNFAKFLRTPFLQNTFGRRLLNSCKWKQNLIVIFDVTTRITRRVITWSFRSHGLHCGSILYLHVLSRNHHFRYCYFSFWMTFSRLLETFISKLKFVYFVVACGNWKDYHENLNFWGFLILPFMLFLEKKFSK